MNKWIASIEQGELTLRRVGKLPPSANIGLVGVALIQKTPQKIRAKTWRFRQGSYGLGLLCSAHHITTYDFLPEAITDCEGKLGWWEDTDWWNEVMRVNGGKA